LELFSPVYFFRFYFFGTSADINIKITLAPGESKTVDFTITTDHLKFYNSDLKYDWEPGGFNIYIGTSSEEVKSEKVNWRK
jgi:beta-glucosidase